jgi:hypothetical protein
MLKDQFKVDKIVFLKCYFIPSDIIRCSNSIVQPYFFKGIRIWFEMNWIQISYQILNGSLRELEKGWRITFHIKVEEIWS